MKRFGGLLIFSLVLASLAFAAPSGQIKTTAEICNPNAPTQCALIDATGNLPVTSAAPGATSTDWTYAAAASGILNTTTAVTIKAAAAAGIRNYISSCQITAEALGAATEFAIRDGAAGTVIWRTKIGAGGLTTGETVEFRTPLRGTAATLLEVVTLTASVTGAVYVNCQGFTGA